MHQAPCSLRLYTNGHAFLRYRIGDWATLGECDCGRFFPALAGIERRAIAQIRRKDGSNPMSPKLIDLLGAVPGLRRFQLLQLAWDSFETLLITEPASTCESTLETPVSGPSRNVWRNSRSHHPVSLKRSAGSGRNQRNEKSPYTG